MLELRDKLPAPAGGLEMTAALASPVEEDVISALVNLGYPRAAADKALLAARGGRVLRVLTCCFARHWGRCRSNNEFYTTINCR